MRVDIGQHLRHDILGRGVCAGAVNAAIRLRQNIGRVVIGAAPDHHAIQTGVQKRLCLIQRGDAPVDRDMQIREQPLHPVHQLVVQGGNVAVFLGAEPLQPRLARVDCHPFTTRADDLRQKLGQHLGGVLVIHADPAFDGHVHIHRAAHRRDGFRHQRRLLHQHRAKTARLHAIRRAADVQVDLVIPRLRPDPRRLCQLVRVRPAKLQGHGMLRGIMIQQMHRATAYQGRRGHHFGIKQRLL